MNINISVTGTDKNDIANQVVAQIMAQIPALMKQYNQPYTSKK
jgi:hypothetical protein